MKVIFLDIDGVLNEEKSKSQCAGYRGIDDSKVQNLKKIVDATGAKIVLISTWKEFWYRDNKQFQGIMANYLDKKLKKQGLFAYDKTRDYFDKQYFSRGEGILDFIEREKVSKFIILDDLQYDYDSCGLTDNYIKTDFNCGGLTAELANKAIEILD